MKSKGFFFLLLSIILVFAVSCERSLNLFEQADAEMSLENMLEVSYDEAQTEDKVASFGNTPFTRFAASFSRRMAIMSGSTMWPITRL